MSSVPRSCFVWLSPLFVLAVSGATLAQEKVPPAAAGTPDGFRREMRFLDLNADRSIDAEELAIGREMAAVMLSMSFDEIDADGSGSVALDEFERAARERLQALVDEQATVDSAEEAAAEEAIADAVPLDAVLAALESRDAYAAEVRALREALAEEAGDPDVVVRTVFANPGKYPKLSPLVRVWLRHYPVNAKLRRHVNHRLHWRYHVSGKPGHVYRPGSRHGVRAGVKGRQPGKAKPAKAPGTVKPTGKKPPKPKAGAKKPAKGAKPVKPAGKKPKPRKR